MVQRPLFAVVLSASATFGPYRGASCSAWQSRSFLSAVFLHRHNSNLVRAFGQPKRRGGSLRRSGRRIADEGRGGRRETCAWHPRAGRGPSNCDLNMRPAPYAEHGEVVSWLFRPEMRRGDSGFVFRPDEISVFCPCSFPMPVADATLWRGSPILRPPRRITNRSTPGFRSLASAVSGLCRCPRFRRRMPLCGMLLPSALPAHPVLAASGGVLVSARWLTGLLPAYFCRK